MEWKEYEMLKWFGRKVVLFWPVSVPGWILFLASPCVWYYLFTPVGIMRLPWSDPGKLEPHLYLSPLWGTLTLEAVLNLIWFSSQKFENFHHFDLKKVVYSLVGAGLISCSFGWNFGICFLVFFLGFHLNEK